MTTHFRTPDDFKGTARALTHDDIVTIAGYLGCHVAAVQAVLKIESAGTGFKSWRPIILFEPHIFYRHLSGTKRKTAVMRGLAYSKWGAQPYPKTQDARYRQLARAIAIDEAAALKSASWGLGQVMGFNHALCGFDTVQEFVRAMMLSEGAQLYCMARFIVSNRLQRHLRRRNWSSFARGYNGSGYAKHGYHTKLASAYARRPLSEKYTPPPADDKALKALRSEEDARITATPKPTGKDLRFYQQALKDLGFYVGKIDGDYGPLTEGAVADFQRWHGGLGVDGVLGKLTRPELEEAYEAWTAKQAA